MPSKLNVAVLGVTGAVGQEFLSILEQRKFPVQNPITLAKKACEGVVVLKKNILDFSLFISILETLVKSIRITIILLDSLTDVCPYIIMSSMNFQCANGISFPHSLRLVYYFLLTFSFIYRLTSSAAWINRNGESGSPCPSP